MERRAGSDYPRVGVQAAQHKGNHSTNGSLCAVVALVRRNHRAVHEEISKMRRAQSYRDRAAGGLKPPALGWRSLPSQAHRGCSTP